MEDSRDVLDIIGNAEAPIKKKNESDLLHLSTGVVVRLKKVPMWYFQKQVNKIPKPRPRTYLNKETGQEEINEAHPDYVREMEEYDNKLSEKTLSILIGLGTELVECPADFISYESDEWVEELAIFDDEFAIDTRPKARYYQWLLYWVVRDEEDLLELADRVREKMGVTVEEVDKAMSMFPDNTTRQTDPAGADQNAGENGD